MSGVSPAFTPSSIIAPNSSSKHIRWPTAELWAIWEKNVKKLFIFVLSSFLENDPRLITAF